MGQAITEAKMPESTRRRDRLGMALTDQYEKAIKRSKENANKVARVILEQWRKLVRIASFPTNINDDFIRIVARVETLKSETERVMLAGFQKAVRRQYDETFQVFVDNLSKSAWVVLGTELATEQVEFRGNLVARDIYDPPTTEEALAAINSTNAADGLLWQERLSKHLPRPNVNRLATIMANGMAEGKGPREIAREINPFVTGYRNRAVTIARTETIRATQVIQREAFKAFDDVIGAWQVVSAGDDRVRERHGPNGPPERRHLTIYVVPGHENQFPGARPLSERPDTPDEIQCRCVVIPKTLPQDDLLALADQKIAALNPQADVTVPGPKKRRKKRR